MKILLFLGLTVLGCIANPDPDPDPGVHINVQINIGVDKLSSGDKNEEIKKLEADIDALETEIAEKEQRGEDVADLLVQLNKLQSSLETPPQPGRRKRQSEVNLGNCGGNDFIGPFETVVLDLLAALTNAAENGGDVSCLLDKLTLLNDEIEAGSVEVPADTTNLIAEIQTTVTETEQYNVEIIEEIKQLQENLEEKQKELEEVINEQGGEGNGDETTALEPEPQQPYYEICSGCGLQLDKRIVGGVDAQLGEVPWVAFFNITYATGLFTSDVARCAGTVITNQDVLTAAHCFHNDVFVLDDIITIEIFVGGVDLYDWDILIYYDKFVRMHQDYNMETLANDIALVKINGQFEFDRYLQPACLGNPDPELPLTAAGWGLTEEYTGGNFNLPDHLQVVYGLNMIGLEQCQQQYVGYTVNITDDNICTLTPDKDTCNGDSGGPNFQKLDGKVSLVGVVSFGEGCADPEYPAVNTNAWKYKEWILSNLDEIKC